MERYFFTSAAVPEQEKQGIGLGKDFLYKRYAAAYKADGLPESDVYTIGIEFTDDTSGHASVSVNGVGAAAVAGYTCCRTGRKRLGAFVLNSRLGGSALLRVTDVAHIVSVFAVPGRDEAVIAQAKAERARPEEIKPAFELKKHIQLVSSAGADGTTPEDLPQVMENLTEEIPYIRGLGFNGVESYVKWNFIEYEKGKYDWSFYDTMIDFAAKFGLSWFPLIIGGSAYALPKWFREETPGFQGFVCLEHGEENNVPTIFNDHQTPYIIKYLHEFGRHYNDNPHVFGARLGPSGNYGESQYPASGNWGYNGQLEHMHIGWWAGDPDASVRFSQWLEKKYGSVAALNEAWQHETAFSSFDEVKTFLPYSVKSLRRRKDFVDWYMYEMTLWCNRWGGWLRETFIKPDIYQSSGGWGLCECGTDFTDQTKGMVDIHGGIRATNEDESYELNFAITRMLSSSARFYGVKFGEEPAGYGTARSIINRLYNNIINNGQHLFYYFGNFIACDESAVQWEKYAPLLDQRSEPLVDVAVVYPDTETKLFDSAVRYLDGSSFFSQVFPLRRKLDYDFCSEQMINDGALEKQEYKALVFLGKSHQNDFIEADALDRIDAWVRAGGTVICPVLHSNASPGPRTVEGNSDVFKRWQAGDTGKGKAVLIHTMREPLDDYIDDTADALREVEGISPLTKAMLCADKPRGVYCSALKSGKLAFYNDLMKEAEVTLPDGTSFKMEPVSIKII